MFVYCLSATVMAVIMALGPAFGFVDSHWLLLCHLRPFLYSRSSRIEVNRHHRYSAYAAFRGCSRWHTRNCLSAPSSSIRTVCS